MTRFFILFLVTSIVAACQQSSKSDTTPTPFFAETQLKLLTAKALENVASYPADSTKIPRSVETDGTIRGVQSKDWTSGFYAGILWQLYKFSQKGRLKNAAEAWTAFQIKEQYDAGTHDLGFKVYCSFGEGYKITKDETYKKIIITTANQLAQRYNEQVGATRSWDFNAHKWTFPVIIDNMMNLELLFEAAKLSRDERLFDMANQHAQTTLKNHFRSDNSSFHVVDYDPETGAVRSKVTQQGYADDSAWARGQAWGLYGYTMAYRFTRNPDYLAQAQKIAQFFFTHPNLPTDKIPYWDFNAPNIPNEEKDVSAAAIAASGLLELSQYDQAHSATYLEWADTILNALSSKKYTAKTSLFFLNQSVGSKPENSEVKVPIIYADYYYVEALLRRLKL